jgi:hypothetical protein
MVMTVGIDTEDLNSATSALMAKSAYDRAFVHSELGPVRAVYSWLPGEGWTKSVEELLPEQMGSNLWDAMRNPRWLSDLDAARDEEIAHVRQEFATRSR